MTAKSGNWQTRVPFECDKALKSLAVFVLVFFTSLSIFARDDRYDEGSPIIWGQPTTSPLFTSDEVLRLRIEAPFDQIFENRKLAGLKVSRWFDAKLWVGDKPVRVKLRVRGHSSRFFCKFPKLMMKLDEPETQLALKGTPFDSTQKVDIGTHCDVDGKPQWNFSGMQFNHREAMIYKWGQILNIPMAAARRALIAYKNSDGLSPFFSKQHQAVLIQHAEEFEKEWGVKEIKGKDQIGAKINSGNLDLPSLYIVERFQIWIGNGDWFASNLERYRSDLHNVRMFEMPSGRLFLSPTDFNLSAISTPTRKNGANLDIDSDRNSGLDDLPRTVRAEVLAKYVNNREKLYQTVEWLRDVDPAGYQSTRGTLDQSYQRLDILLNQPDLKSR